jgi:DNA-binding NtrC family response regulator
MQFDDSSIVNVLAVLPRRADRTALIRIFGHSSWKLDLCGSLAEARARLRDGETGVVVCDSELPDGDWKDLLGGLPTDGRAPRLIVAISSLDDRLWAEVLNLGGYDALVKPFHKDEVVQLVSQAWLSWKSSRAQMLPERRPAQVHIPSSVEAMAS